MCELIKQAAGPFLAEHSLDRSMEHIESSMNSNQSSGRESQAAPDAAYFASRMARRAAPAAASPPPIFTAHFSCEYSTTSLAVQRLRASAENIAAHYILHYTVERHF